MVKSLSFSLIYLLQYLWSSLYVLSYLTFAKPLFNTDNPHFIDLKTGYTGKQCDLFQARHFGNGI